MEEKINEIEIFYKLNGKFEDGGSGILYYKGDDLFDAKNQKYVKIYSGSKLNNPKLLNKTKKGTIKYRNNIQKDRDDLLKIGIINEFEFKLNYDKFNTLNETMEFILGTAGYVDTFFYVKKEKILLKSYEENFQKYFDREINDELLNNFQIFIEKEKSKAKIKSGMGSTYKWAIYYACKYLEINKINNDAIQKLNKFNNEFKQDKDFIQFLENEKVLQGYGNPKNTSVSSAIKYFLEFLRKINLKELNNINNLQISQNITNKVKESNYLSLNTIFYGVPGCGKSFYVKSLLSYKDENGNITELDKKYQKRVLFHPEYTYSDFVGQIMPVVEGADKITYKFVPGPFIEILKNALKDKDNHYFLIIEEINRGNAPAIFGNIFQLLDRDNNGKSEYEIYDKSILEYLNSELKKANKPEIESVYIPSNLTIFATMNTCDQNVFTLDTAFKRRWRMHRIENDFDTNDENEKQFLEQSVGNLSFTWKEFATALNNALLKIDNGGMIAEDKQLGTHFVKQFELENIEAFAEKVLMYLWNDVVKYNKEQLFKSGEDYNTLDKVIKKFAAGENVFSENCQNLKLLYEKPQNNNQPSEEEIIENTDENENNNGEE